jgi:hypothetical protein
VEEEVANQSTGGARRVDRRIALRVGTALAATGLLHAEEQRRQQGASITGSQVHAYAANTPERPWHNVPNWPAYVTGDEMVVAMNKVGVADAIYISPFSMYRHASYAVSVQRVHPDRFALVKPVQWDWE